MPDVVKEVAKAIRKRREELIAQPLSRIYEDLAVAAIKALSTDEPNVTPLA